MFGLGTSEILLLFVVASMGLAALGVLYLVVRSAVRAGKRDR